MWDTVLKVIEFVQSKADFVTALATVALVYATWVLARETRILSRATSQPHVTATLEPNVWSARYVDLIVSNSGNGVAYDIEINLDPPLPKGSRHRKSLDASLTQISIIRPSQSLHSNICDFIEVSNKKYKVTVRWKRHPKSKRRESLSYELSMSDYSNVSYLVSRSPLTKIADEVQKLRKDWGLVARGIKRIQADIYSANDRLEEERMREELFQQIGDECDREA